MFHYESIATGRTEGAERRLYATPLGQSDVEELYESVAYIVDYPFVEDVTHEFPEGLRCDAPGCYDCSLRIWGNDGASF